jgi:hypothetical protein
MITFIPEYNAGGLGYITTGKESQISYDKIKTDADRARFLSQFGWEISATPIESAEIIIPDQFDKIFTGYNEMQKRQGLDLSKYKRKDVMRYTYEITNYPGYEGTVYINLLIYRNRVIGGDVCSADAGGFIHGFAK